MEATFIKADGTIQGVSPENGEKSFSLKELQTFVGGYIEFVRFKDKIMVVNEEGKLHDLPLNKKATAIFVKELPHINDIIVGNVLICDKNLID